MTESEVLGPREAASSGSAIGSPPSTAGSGSRARPAKGRSSTPRSRSGPTTRRDEGRPYGRSSGAAGASLRVAAPGGRDGGPTAARLERRRTYGAGGRQRIASTSPDTVSAPAAYGTSSAVPRPKGSPPSPPEPARPTRMEKPASSSSPPRTRSARNQ